VALLVTPLISLLPLSAVPPLTKFAVTFATELKRAIVKVLERFVVLVTSASVFRSPAVFNTPAAFRYPVISDPEIFGLKSSVAAGTTPITALLYL
jgi:hypothetical protein